MSPSYATDKGVHQLLLAAVPSLPPVQEDNDGEHSPKDCELNNDAFGTEVKPADTLDNTAFLQPAEGTHGNPQQP